MRDFTIDPESRETLYFHEVVRVDSLQKCIMIKLETHYKYGRPSVINYKVDTEANGIMLPLHDLYMVKPAVDLDSLAHTINPNVKLEAYMRNDIKQDGQVCFGKIQGPLETM